LTGSVKSKHRILPTNKHQAPAFTEDRPAPVEGLDTADVMAAFRQAARGRGWTEREEMLREVAGLVGYQRLGPRIRETLKGHFRAAIRRGILESDGDFVRALTVTMDDYTLEALRDTLISVMRKGTTYNREEVIQAVAHHLGFTRITTATRHSLKSALNSAIRQGVLGYEGNLLWRAY
jgi:hypothetical protein